MEKCGNTLIRFSQFMPMINKTKPRTPPTCKRVIAVNITNIKDTEGFSLKLAELFKDLYQLFEIVKEREISPKVTEPPEWPGDTGKTCFEVSGQFERPHDFFVTLLDLIRVTYEPTFFGTFFLNANWGFLLQEMPESPFRLGYLTAISEPGEGVASLFAQSIQPQMQQYNYSFNAANAVFVMASFSKDRLSIELMVEVNELFGSGFSVDDALGTIAGELKGESYQKPGNAYSGFSIDNSLGERLRLSLWLFLPHLQ